MEVSAMDTHTYLNVKLLLSPRQSRGITHWIHFIYLFSSGFLFLRSAFLASLVFISCIIFLACSSKSAASSGGKPNSRKMLLPAGVMWPEPSLIVGLVSFLFCLCFMAHLISVNRITSLALSISKSQFRAISNPSILTHFKPKANK